MHYYWRSWPLGNCLWGRNLGYLFGFNLCHFSSWLDNLQLGIPIANSLCCHWKIWGAELCGWVGPVSPLQVIAQFRFINKSNSGNFYHSYRIWLSYFSCLCQASSTVNLLLHINGTYRAHWADRLGLCKCLSHHVHLLSTCAYYLAGAYFQFRLILLAHTWISDLYLKARVVVLH